MNSGDKGKRFELKCAKLLSEWSGLELMRTPMSGGWAGEAADIVPKFGAHFPFVVECKHEEGWEFDHLFNNSGPFPRWIAQAVEQAEYKSRETGNVYFPMLMFTRNRRYTYLMIPERLFLIKDSLQQIPTRIIYTNALGIFVVGEAVETLGNLSYDLINRESQVNCGR